MLGPNYIKRKAPLDRWNHCQLQGKKPVGEGLVPSRGRLQDFTGAPAVVDLAAMRDAISRMGGEPKLINPLRPADLVIGG